MSGQIAQPVPYAERLFEGFENLMPFRVEDILIVSSLYDSFILREDGQLNELLIGDSLELHLQHIPNITHVSSGKAALAQVQAERHFNLIVASLRTGRHERCATGARSEAGRTRCSGGGARLRLWRGEGLPGAQSA